MKLTKSDKLILESYKTMIEGLAKYLPNSYELVLHSLENLEESVIAIYNGEHTGRKVGAPITDLALNLLEQINNGNEDSIVYFSKNNALMVRRTIFFITKIFCVLYPSAVANTKLIVFIFW